MPKRIMGLGTSGAYAGRAGLRGDRAELRRDRPGRPQIRLVGPLCPLPPVGIETHTRFLASARTYRARCPRARAIIRILKSFFHDGLWTGSRWGRTFAQLHVWRLSGRVKSSSARARVPVLPLEGTVLLLCGEY